MRRVLVSKLASRPNRLTVITPPSASSARQCAVELGAVEHRAGRLVVVEIDAEHVGRCRRAPDRRRSAWRPSRGPRSGPNRRGSRNHWRQTSMTRGLSSTAVVRIFSRLLQKRVIAPAPRPSWTAWPRGPLGRVAQQHPDHHAAHVLELDRERVVDPHRALDPGRAEVQVAHARRLGDRHFGQRRAARARRSCAVLGERRRAAAAPRGRWRASPRQRTRRRRRRAGAPARRRSRASSAGSLRIVAPAARASAVR